MSTRDSCWGYVTAHFNTSRASGNRSWTSTPTCEDRSLSCLAGLLLVRSGCFPAKINVELNGSMELDAVGFTDSDGIGECRVVEVKKQSTDQIQLQREIERFKEKIDSIRDDPSVVARDLGVEVPIEKVTGIFISMARLGSLDDETRGTARCVWSIPERL